MNMNTIGSAMMIIYDELKNDKQSKKLIKQIDEAENDDDIKKGIVAAVNRLIELGKPAVAEDIKNKTRGFAY